MATINFTSRISTTAADGILLEATVIEDKALKKTQAAINQEVGTLSTSVKTLEQKVELLSGDLNSVAGIYNPKGSVESYDSLPMTGNSIGDVYNVKEQTVLEFEDGSKETYAPGTNFVWIELEGGTKYTEAEVIAGNAALEGAIASGTEMTEDQIAAVNEALGEEKYSADNATISEEDSIAFNATLEGAKTTEDWKEAPVLGWDAMGGDIQGAYDYTDSQIKPLDEAINGDGTSDKPGLLAQVGALESTVGSLDEAINGEDGVLAQVGTLESSVNTLSETINGDGSDDNPGLLAQVSSLQESMDILTGDGEGSIQAITQSIVNTVINESLEWIDEEGNPEGDDTSEETTE